MTTRSDASSRSRLLLLGLILLAFLRLTWQLDAKALWWDESLTLQRAESSWWPLLNATLLHKDGISEFPTTDQHPFFFFVVTSILIRFAGISEFALRLPAVMAATLLVPLVWVMASAMRRDRIVAPSAPVWGALFAAVSPVYLWYGQEARPYALWAALALLSTYCLWRATRANSIWTAAYLFFLVLFLTTQYYALFLVPLHALMVWGRLIQTKPRTANLLLGAVAIATIGVGALVGWYLLSRTGGENFDQIPITILLPDLLNAYSPGVEC